MPVSFKITAVNLANIIRRVAGLPSEQQAAMKVDIDTTLLSILRDSKTKPPRVPVDTGALQSTGFTEPSKIEGPRLLASVGYGGIAPSGTTVDYAVYVHDNANGRIKNYKRPGSGPKFLEVHFTREMHDLRGTLQAALGKAWGKTR